MIHTKDILKSLPLLAGVLGKKYGVEVRIGGGEAYTNGNCIQLPALPTEGDATLLMQVRGLLDHEAAHIRFTDFEALRDAKPSPVLKHLWNTLEDYAVEHRLAALYPGCEYNFRRLIEHFFMARETEAEDSNPASAILNGILLTVRSWDAPAILPHKNQVLSIVQQAYPRLWPNVEAVLSKVQGQQMTSVQNMQYAKKLLQLLKEEDERQQKKQNSSTKKDNNKNTVKSNGNDNKQTNTDESSGESTPQNSEKTTNGNEQKFEKTLPRCAAQALEDLLEGNTPCPLPEQLGEKLKAALGEIHSPESRAVRVATAYPKEASPLTPDALALCRASTNVLRCRLHRMLQATGYVPVSPSVRGKLCGGYLYRLATNNARVFMNRGEKPILSTAVHLLLDSSGSMAGLPIQLAVQACYAVASALHSIQGVNVAVTTFPGKGGLHSATVSPILAHGQRFHANMQVYANGGTPLGEALWWVMQQMVSLREQRKIILILTDGAPNDVPLASKTLARAHDCGFEVYGIGCGTDSLQYLLPASREISRLEDLTPAMFDLLQPVLVNNLKERRV